MGSWGSSRRCRNSAGKRVTLDTVEVEKTMASQKTSLCTKEKNILSFSRKHMPVGGSVRQADGCLLASDIDASVGNITLCAADFCWRLHEGLDTLGAARARFHQCCLVHKSEILLQVIWVRHHWVLAHFTRSSAGVCVCFYDSASSDPVRRDLHRLGAAVGHSDICCMPTAAERLERMRVVCHRIRVVHTQAYSNSDGQRTGFSLRDASYISQRNRHVGCGMFGLRGG